MMPECGKRLPGVRTARVADSGSGRRAHPGTLASTSADAGGLGEMDDPELRSALRQARPIGGDVYGRPGKRMGDAGG